MNGEIIQKTKKSFEEAYGIEINKNKLEIYVVDRYNVTTLNLKFDILNVWPLPVRGGINISSFFSFFDFFYFPLQINTSKEKKKYVST